MLELIARKYTSPYCDVIRAKIILLADEGLSNDVIASRLDTPHQIVSKWRKRFALGNIEAGSSLAIRTLLAKPDPSSIFTNASGRALHSVPMITSSAQTKRPVFKPAAENSRRRRRRPIAPRTASMSTSAWGPGPIWQLGMSIEQESSAAVKSKVELLRWTGLWATSWGKSLTNRLVASFGSWTTARLIEGRRPQSVA
jgi:hypothetical protein